MCFEKMILTLCISSFVATRKRAWITGQIYAEVHVVYYTSDVHAEACGPWEISSIISYAPKSQWRTNFFYWFAEIRGGNFRKYCFSLILYGPWIIL